MRKLLVNDGVPSDLLNCITLFLRAVQDVQAREAAQTFLSDPDFDWKGFQKVVQRNRVGAILYNSVVQAKLPFVSFLDLSRDLFLTSTWRNSINLIELKNLLKQFSADQISVVILKGAALLFTVYPHIGLRQMSDIDLLVRIQDIDRVSKILLEQGYTRYGLSPWLPSEYLREITFSKKNASLPVTIDLHGSITSPPHHLSREQKEWFLNNSIEVEKDGLRVNVLKTEAQILHLCWHVIHHYGGDLQSQYDIHELIRQNILSIDWGEILRVGKAFNLLIPMQLVLPQLFEDWKTPIPEAVLEDLVALQPSRREQQIYQEPYGRESRRPLTRLWLELTGYDNWHERLGYFWYRLFPRFEFMKENYGARTRGLLPFSYLYRWGVSMMRKNKTLFS